MRPEIRQVKGSNTPNMRHDQRGGKIAAMVSLVWVFRLEWRVGRPSVKVLVLKKLFL